MKLLADYSTDPHFNMALDQWCLEHLDVSEPVLWLWRNAPSVIVGENQNVYAEVNLQYLEANGIVLARRATGGGAVYHDLQNLNYSMVGASSDIGDGTLCVEKIASALRAMGADAVVSGRNDILVDGRKVSGFARRNWKNRTLVHGTLMYDVDVQTLTRVLDAPGSKLHAKGVASVRSRVTNLKDYIPGGIDHLREELATRLTDGEMMSLTEDDLAEIQALARNKFAAGDWIYGHSGAIGIIRSAHFPCGTVAADMLIDGGRISSVLFSGDFIGLKPVSGLSELLSGVVYDRKSISERLVSTEVSEYLLGVTADGLADMLCGLSPD